MKRIILAAALALATPAMAEEPTTLLMPTQVIGAMVQYLNSQPRGAVEGLATAIEGCARVQIANAQGATISHGECPTVTDALGAAMRAKAAPVAADEPTAPKK